MPHKLNLAIDRGTNPSSLGVTDQKIESRRHQPDRRLKIVGEAMPHVLGMADHGQHRQDGLDEHPVVPFATAADLQTGWIAMDRVKTRSREQYGVIVEPVKQRAKSGVVSVGGRPDPAHDFAEMIDHDTPLRADDPAMVGNSGLAELLGAAAPADRMDQFDAIAVHNAQPRELRQEPEGQLPMGLQAAEEPGAFRQARKQGSVVLANPAIKGPLAHALDCEQHPQGNEFAGPERRLGMLGEVQHPIVDAAEHR